jgi:aspartate aminotransferase
MATLNSGNKMSIPGRVEAIIDSPFDRLYPRAAALRAQGHEVVNLSQGFPPFGPSALALDAVGRALARPESHRYGPNAGLQELRDALATALRGEGMDVESEEIVITAGGNQAFQLALMTTVDPGARVVLPSPYFPNHEMVVRAHGCVPVEAPIADREGFQPTWDDLAPYVDGAAAVVLCTPANPTGARVSRDEMERIVGELAARRVRLIADETYLHFLFGERDGEAPTAHVSAASVKGWRETVVLTGSFSKSFGVMGWRVGFLGARRDVLRHAIKIQDATVICAPVPFQAALAEVVRAEWDYTRRALPGLEANRRAVSRALAGSRSTRWTPTTGGIFAFLRIATQRPSAEISRELLERAGLITIPGTAFGTAGEGHLRISYSQGTPESLESAVRKLAECIDSLATEEVSVPQPPRPAQRAVPPR